ncbi:TonB-dependent receptor plug domain-containing protein [Rhodospirillum centenum]|uniref:TonB-dependent receptor, putative n=1 Tax=Rhodospirillum centenum (strain ATCC 51521 / SW) TaxID=414684 RepID=B6IXP2_RHOCS|nr:TonB-dependent receptor [Rhodospirillum centenum]ACJ01066.1 TonB-dependent receptor, putative [Rhodospirillum centenum SW]
MSRLTGNHRTRRAPGTLRAVMLAGAALGTLAAALPATAQTPQGQVEEIIVTGSRIRQGNLTSTSPVTVIGSEEFAFQGTTRVEDLVNNLPQAFADQGGNVSNGSTGTATVDLRNLGPTRTLVLVDGKRLPAGTPGGTDASSAPDLNQIPASLVERVEVVTGGASAVYGSDAVAGVVNFIMQDDFEGARVDAQYSFFQHKNDNRLADVVRAANYELPKDDVTDGFTRDITGVLGMNSANGKGNITIYAGYREIDPVVQSKRDYSSCALGSNDDGSGYVCAGSATSYPGYFVVGDDQELTLDQATGGFRPFNLSTDLYNFGPLNYYQRPDERYTAGAFGRYEFNEAVEVYSTFMFHDDRTVAQIAPSGLFVGSFTTPCSNPFLSPQQAATLCTAQGLGPDDTAELLIGRRNVEGGGRQDDLRHTSYRFVGGFRGDFMEGWSYDASYQYGTVVFAENYRNDFSIARSQRALDVVTDPATGQPACRSFVDGTDPACRPYNVFQIGGVTQEALDYLQTPGFQEGETVQEVLTASVSGDLGQYGVRSPLATDGIAIALGAEYRREELELRTDAAFTTGDLAGQGGPTISVDGAFDVRELFGELRLPLVQDKPFVQQLSLDLGYRWSDYSTSGTTNTYKVAGDWSLTADVRLRASYNRAVRAPNVRELFAAQGVGLFDLSADPCSGATPTFSLEQCANTGVTPEQYGRILNNPAGQFNQLAGGNTDLDPEKSDTIALGAVFTPGFLANFSVALDYFRIKLEDQIGTVPPTLALDQCGRTGDPYFCGFIQRGAGGSLWTDPQGYIEAFNLNLGTLETSGIDLEVAYRMDLADLGLPDRGGLSFSFIGTWLDKFESRPVPVLDVEYDCAGYYGPTCEVPLPEWRHKARVTWSAPFGLDVSLSWRHIAKVNLDLSSDDPDLNGSFAAIDETLDSQDYFDLAANWEFYEGFTLNAGVNNLFDNDPPVSSEVGTGFGNGNTYPQVYDALGRYVFVGLTAQF